MRLGGRTVNWGDEHVQQSNVVNVTHVEAVAKGKVVLDVSRLVVALLVATITGFDIGAITVAWLAR